MPGHSLDALADDRQRVLGQVDQDRPWLRHRVLVQASRTSGYGEGHVQTQPGLRALGGTADHTNRTGAPELFHKPTLAAWFAFNLTHAHHRKRLFPTRWHFHTFAFFFCAGREFLG